MTNPNLTPVQNNDIQETAEQELIRLRAENASLKAKKGQEGSLCKITPKGGLSVYGLGRFPVTLYKSQWLKLLGMVADIQAFIDANGDKLTEKAKADTQEVA